MVAVLLPSATVAPLIGAPMVYQQLRRWMEGKLGFRFGPTAARDGGGSAGAPTVPADLNATHAGGE